MVKQISLLKSELGDCTACHYGKITRKPFPRTTLRVTRKLQLVHTIVGGLMSTPSLHEKEL